MRKFALILVLLFTASSYACEIPLGEYGLFTYSEWGVKLTLLAENKFKLLHASWLPGQPETYEETEYEGTWLCKAAVAEFSYRLETITAMYKKHDPYPLGIYKDSKALVFLKSDNKSSPLSEGVFWPAKP